MHTDVTNYIPAAHGICILAVYVHSHATNYVPVAIGTSIATVNECHWTVALVF